MPGGRVGADPHHHDGIRDFAEGVRAMVVDKDRKPRWQPARIEDVDPAVIAAMFD